MYLYNTNFSQMYNEIKEKYPHIYSLDEVEITKFNDDLEDFNRKNMTKLAIVINIFFILFVILAPIVSFNFLSLSKLIRPKLLLLFNQKPSFITNGWIHLYYLLVFFIVILLTVVIPKMLNKDEYIEGKDIKINISNVNSGKFIFYAVICNYFLLAIPFIYLISYDLLPEIILNKVISFWLGVPLVITASGMTFYILIILIGIGSEFFIPRYLKNSSTSIIINLTYLIYYLSKMSNRTLTERKIKKKVVKIVKHISNLIEKSNDLLLSFEDALSQWGNEQMELAATNYYHLLKSVYLPQGSSLEDLIFKYCNYLNMFLTCDYQSLPREELIDNCSSQTDEENSRWRKKISFVFLGLYCVFPPIIFAILVMVLNIEIPQVANPFLRTAYVIWILVGIILFEESLFYDLIDIFKEITKKRFKVS